MCPPTPSVSLGDSTNAPFDAIHVGAAAATIPEELLKQLKNGGRMIIPVGKQFETQVLLCVDKDQNGVISQRTITE
jgi:protein-L-isoaspartate(D-aspartate) O-methyltransferase